MADYNVQMKQYNGTSFDNILPYASQALTLAGGGGATEIIAQARAGLSQIATGSYVGTGTYGQNNPTVITCGFRPKYVYVYYLAVGNYSSVMYYRLIGFDSVDSDHNDTNAFLFNSANPDTMIITSGATMVVSFEKDGISFYVSGAKASAVYQLNQQVSASSEGRYYYVAIG